MKGAVFLDRDGTLNEEVGYINHIDHFRLFPWSSAAVKKLNQAGIPVVVLTNQSGVARGYFPESLVQEIHASLEKELGRCGAHLDGIYYCPHHPDGIVPAFRESCDCRKPGLGMMQRAARDLHLDLGTSFVVSDRYQDISMALRAGARGVLLLTGYGKEEYQSQKDAWPRQPDHVAVNLLAAVDWILAQIDEEGRARSECRP